MKKFALLVVFLFGIALVAPLGFSQGSGSGSGGTASTSTSGSNAAVTTNYYGGGSSVQAYPGPSSNPGPFPGYIKDNGVWSQYWNPLIPEVSKSQMEMGRGHDKVKTVVLTKDAVPENNDPIHILSWSPFGSPHYDADRVIGITDVQGKPFEPLEAALLAGLYDAKEKTHSNRCVVFLRQMNIGVTKGLSIGTGGANGSVLGPGTNNVTQAFALGGVFGTNKAYGTDYPEFRIISLNTGSNDPPEPPKPPKQSEVPVKDEEPKIPAPPPVPLAPPPAQLQPQPQPAPVVSVVSCDIPEFVVRFGFNKSEVKDEYLPEIERIAVWLRAHPSCKVQVQGHASIEGTFGYNAALGRSRSVAVYNLLLADGVEKVRMQFASLSKDFPASEYQPENRRVILRVIDGASGK